MMKLQASTRLEGPISKVRFHPTRSLLACGRADGDEVTFWTWDEGGLRLLHRTGSAARKCITDLAFHPSADLVAIAGIERDLEVLALADRDGGIAASRVHLLRPPVAVKPPAPHAHLLPAFVHEINARLNLAHAQRPRTYSDVVFSPDGPTVIANSTNDTRCEIFNLPSAELVDTFWEAFGALRLHPEKRILATATRTSIGTDVLFVFFEQPGMRYGDVILALDINPLGGLSFDWSGKRFAVIGGVDPCRVRMLEFPSCVAGRSFSFPSPYPKPPWTDLSDALWHWCDNLVFSGDGTVLHIPLPGGELLAVDVETGAELERCPGHEGYVISMDAHPRQPYVATGGSDGLLGLWEFDDLKDRSGPKDEELSADFARHVERYDSSRLIRFYRNCNDTDGLLSR